MNIPKLDDFNDARKWLLAIGSETVARPVLAWLAKRHAPTATTPTSSWRKGLLLGADHIGDVLYRTASLGKLQEILPACEWHWLVHPPAHQVLEGNPFVKKTLVPPPGLARRDLVETIRNENYDVGICYDVGAHIGMLRLLVEAGIPNRVAYTHKGFSAWVTRPVTFRPRQPYPGYFRDLVAELGQLNPCWALRPRVYPSVEDESAAKEFAERHNLAEHPRILACFVTSRQPKGGVWPLDNFVHVMKNLTAEKGIALVLCGTSGDRSVLEYCSQQLSKPPVICAGDLSLRALTCFLGQCRAVLSADSGPRHLANAAGTPVVFVRNPLSRPIETGEYCEGEFDFGDLPDSQQVSAVERKLHELLK